MRLISTFNLLTTARGVLAGTITPPHDTASKPGWPAASAIVGKLGKAASLCRVVTASAFSLPDCTCGAPETTVVNMVVIWPPMMSVNDRPSPL